MTPLRFAIDICPLGPLSDPRQIVRLAVAAEESGWHGISVWDSLGVSMGSGAVDPFVALSGVAARTEGLRLITSIVALARRRPQLVVQAAASLDLLSGGRLVLGLGAGDDPGDFEPFGESNAAAERIPRMDEALAIVDGLLQGRKVDHRGPLLTARDVSLGPRALQEPRPPVWLGAMKPAGLRRAARWDGWIAVAMSEDGTSMALDPERFTTLVAQVHATRRTEGVADRPFDIAVLGLTGGESETRAADFGAAGATWWLESLSPMRGSIDDLEALVRVGPPL